MTPTRFLALTALPLLALAAGCSKKGELVIDSGVGVTALRTACPTVGVPDFTGDVTQFSAPGRTDAAGIDLTASLTNVRSTCNDAGEKVYTVPISTCLPGAATCAARAPSSCPISSLWSAAEPRWSPSGSAR